MAEQLVWKGVKNSSPDIIEYFKECFTLTDEGILLWKERPREHFQREKDWKRHLHKAGQEAGHKKKGRYTFYKRVKLLGSTIEVHTICWCIYYNEFPKDSIDHIDGNGLNNRKSNLRDHSNSKNKVIGKLNKSGCMGIHWHKTKKLWIATGEHKQLAATANLFEAVCARKSWENKNGYTPR